MFEFNECLVKNMSIRLKIIGENICRVGTNLKKSVILSAKRRLHIVYFDKSCAPKLKCI